MTVAQYDPIHLHRIDPTRNMARFYRVTIEKTLFGEAVVHRNWGRIGTHGRSLSVVLKEFGEAEATAARLCEAKRRRGYRDAAGCG